ncbi:MAG TPA: TlpA disulfide reductase family protein, partial [Bacteroidota bacterium]
MPAQVLRVDLPRLGSIDDEGLHVSVSTPKPTMPLVLPNIDTVGARFYSLFYTRISDGDLLVYFMTIPTRAGQHIFIDTNLNNDLRDDGLPHLFPDSSNSFIFQVASPRDPNALTRFLLQRRPDLPESSLVHFLDVNGNLQPRQARFWAAAASASSFTGARGTFFFDSRLSLKRGSTQIGSQKQEIGLFDYNNDGFFNGKDDVLLVDFPHPGKLEYFACSIAFDDVFAFDTLRLTVSNADPYGRWVELAITSKPVSVFKPTKAENLARDGFTTTAIDEALWALQVNSIEGDTIALSHFRGRFLLLNFWGEWCKPCLDEIPVLVKASA